jgi:hypothetical protein
MEVIKLHQVSLIRIGRYNSLVIGKFCRNTQMPNNKAANIRNNTNNTLLSLRALLDMSIRVKAHNKIVKKFRSLILKIL